MERLEREAYEIDRLIGKGIGFELTVNYVKTERYCFGLRKRERAVSETQTFYIEEPTLGTLDRMSREWIEVAKAHDTNDSDQRTHGAEHSNDLYEAQQLVAQHSERVARILAIAVLGSKNHRGQHREGVIHYHEDTAELDKLTHLFYHNIKPSDLANLLMQIIIISNIGDFCNSIRLMSKTRSTVPSLVE